MTPTFIALAALCTTFWIEHPTGNVGMAGSTAEIQMTLRPKAMALEGNKTFIVIFEEPRDPVALQQKLGHGLVITGCQ